MTFEELQLNHDLLDGLDAIGFKEATPIQEKAIPVILEKRDLIACAQTGTGKTAAFLLPVIDQIQEKEPGLIHALILVPTRELAIQIDRQLEGLAYFTQVTSIPIYGGRDGTSFDQEKKALTQGADIVVATPGRLIAHLQLGYVKFGNVSHLILDEADRMLDMGFVDDITKIVKHLPADRQTLMFSATMPAKIRKFAQSTLTDPEQITLAVSKPAKSVVQAVYMVEDEYKASLLRYLLFDRKEKEETILVFASRKTQVRDVTRALKQAGLPAAEIHSNLDQAQREQTLRDFRNGKVRILVATDILSRGIDVKGINLVINYSVPKDPEDYIHRIGRTARASADGMALTFVNRLERRKLEQTEALMDMQVRRLPVPDGLVAERQERRGGGRGRHGGGGRGRGGNRGGGGGRGRNGGGGRRGGGGRSGGGKSGGGGRS